MNFLSIIFSYQKSIDPSSFHQMLEKVFWEILPQGLEGYFEVKEYEKNK